MNKISIKYWLILIAMVVAFINANSQTTIDQKLSVFSNSGIIGGNFVVDYQVKGSNLPTAKTLGSLNADIIYDSSLVRFNEAYNWHQNLSESNGYEKFVNDNPEIEKNRSLRIMVIALNVNSDSSGTQPVFNLENAYTSIVRLSFTILDNSKSISLSFKSSTNQVGLFTNPANNPNTFEISDQILSNPVTIENEPLPVLFAEFNSIIKSDNVTLKWTTSSEQNNSGFKVERKQMNSNWVEIGFVKGKGNSNSTSQYIFDDNKLSAGKYNYRLKQIDNNGNFAYHNLSTMVEIGIPIKFNLSQNYPNPFNPKTKIDYELPADSKVNLTVFDILGREMISLVNQEQKAGYYTISADSKNLASGTYFYRLIAKSGSNEFITTKKMSVIK